jgi:hypothetical protein
MASLDYKDKGRILNKNAPFFSEKNKQGKRLAYQAIFNISLRKIVYFTAQLPTLNPAE